MRCAAAHHQLSRLIQLHIPSIQDARGLVRQRVDHVYSAASKDEEVSGAAQRVAGRGRRRCDCKQGGGNKAEGEVVLSSHQLAFDSLYFLGACKFLSRLRTIFLRKLNEFDAVNFLREKFFFLVSLSAIKPAQLCVKPKIIIKQDASLPQVSHILRFGRVGDSVGSPHSLRII
jgi:hypothetical protein